MESKCPDRNPADKNRQYPEAVTNYTDNILLVGISYDKKQKTHNCVIEKYSEK